MSLTAGLFNSGIFKGGLFNGRLFANASSPPTSWYLTVVTTGASQDYTVDINSGTGIDIYIDWGDTSSNAYTTTGQKTHTYASAGTYTIKISGAFTSGGNIRLGSNSGNRSRLKAVSPIPQLPGFTNLSYGLGNCTGLTGSIPTDLLRYVTACTNLSFFIFGCTGLTGSIPTDLLKYVTGCTTLYGFMQGCTGITGSIPTDLLRYVTACTNLSGTFASCTGLTGPIPTDLLRYVIGCTNLSYFISDCSGLDTTVPADLLRYVTNCTNFDIFARNITWTTASYSALIISMNTYLTKTGVPFHGGNSKYDTSAAAAHNNLTGVKGWTITDGGPA